MSQIITIKHCAVKLTLNDVQTYFHGLSLDTLKTQTNSAGLLNECLANTLDEMYPKVVADSNNSRASYNGAALISSGQTIPVSGGSGRSVSGSTVFHGYIIKQIFMGVLKSNLIN